MKRPTSDRFFKKLGGQSSVCRKHCFWLIQAVNYFVFFMETFLRPFCRRRLRTRLPADVRLRTKNPCDFARFRFFGLYVNDIVEQLYSKVGKKTSVTIKTQMFQEKNICKNFEKSFQTIHRLST